MKEMNLTTLTRGLGIAALSVGALSTQSFAQCTAPQVEVGVTFFMDFWPEEIGWRVEDPNNPGVALPGCEVAPGTYTGLQCTTVTDSCCVDPGCYTLIVIDTFGDGIISATACDPTVGNAAGIEVTYDGAISWPFIQGLLAGPGGGTVEFGLLYVGDCDGIAPEGACCDLSTLNCFVDSIVECRVLGLEGLYAGDGTDCVTDPCPAAVTNETCDTATVVNSLPYSESLDTTTATSDGPWVGSCNTTTTVTDQDVWWCYTPASDEFITVSADGAYDIIVTVWEADPDCASLTEVVCIDNNVTAPSLEEGTFLAAAGTTYYIQVGDWGTSDGGGPTDLTITGAPADDGACCLDDGTCVPNIDAVTCVDTLLGRFYGGAVCGVDITCIGACCIIDDPDGCDDLSVTDCATAGGTYQGDGTDCATVDPQCPVTPDNDSCETAEAVLALPFSASLDNTGATDNTDYNCGVGFNGAGISGGLWFTVVGDGTTYTATTCSATSGAGIGDTLLEVWCGCDPTNCLGGNDDDAACADGTLLSTFSWCANDGVTYWIHVGGWSTARGAFTLDITSDGVACAEATCTPVGACCIDDVCSVQTEADCLAALGQYLGDGTNCEGTNLGGIADASFEVGTPSTDWTEASTNFGTPLCDAGTCGLGGGTGPQDGAWWVWCGGITGAFEEASVEQNITIDANADVMTFYFELPVSEGLATDSCQVLLDGNVVFEALGNDPLAGIVGYGLISIDLATAPGGPYNDGGSHLLRIQGVTDSVANPTNFFFDNFAIGEAFECPQGPDCPYDVTGPNGVPDGEVGVPDFFGLLQSWGPCPGGTPGCDYDVTGAGGVPDGEVGVPDFFGLLQTWGPC
jgi:hypothetical protein